MDGHLATEHDDHLALFETGAIVFHIAERHAGLLPGDADARARAITWMFAALNTAEPPILERGTGLLEGDKTWYDERLPLFEDYGRDRLEGEMCGADKRGAVALPWSETPLRTKGFPASHGLLGMWRCHSSGVSRGAFLERRFQRRILVLSSRRPLALFPSFSPHSCALLHVIR
jgi:hypothetical protein